MAANFINTDLVLKARFDLRPLTMALKEKGVFCLAPPKARGGVWQATMETSSVRPLLKKTTEEMLAAIESLEGEGRVAWDRCLLREFDFGFESETGGFVHESVLEEGLLRRIAAVGAAIKITIYRPSQAGGE